MSSWRTADSEGIVSRTGLGSFAVLVGLLLAVILLVRAQVRWIPFFRRQFHSRQSYGRSKLMQLTEAQTFLKRRERRFQLIQLLCGQDWRCFRLLVEAMMLKPGQAVAVDQDLAQRFYSTIPTLRELLGKLEAAGLVITRWDESGETQAYWLPSDGPGKQFIDQLFA